MANSVNYLVSSANFKQVNPDIPITKTREKAATPEEFEGLDIVIPSCLCEGR
jgi:hypothetical protein